MKKMLLICTYLLMFIVSNAQDRFPRPDFESGYQYPEITYRTPNEALWTTIDIALLVILMSIAAFAVLKRRRQKPIMWISVFSIAYFGFFRKGCVCSIGSIQNVSLALADNTYILPLSVLFFFILPILFTFLFGRVFCSGVCPFGALQELVNLRSYRVPKAPAAVLGMIPWFYLILAILFAVTQSSFIICRYDPFIGIFRLGGDFILIMFGALLLVSAVFTGRPFCRFLCPYGALLSLFARVSIWKVEITKQTCINCELCHNSCPIDAIMAPFDNKIKESRLRGVRRIINYLVILPLIALAGALLMRSASESLSRVNKDVRLYDLVVEHQHNPADVLSPELEGFYGQEVTTGELNAKYEKIQTDFKRYSTIAGAMMGLAVGITLIRLSMKRTRKFYEINGADCVACGRCFRYCPQNLHNEAITSGDGVSSANTGVTTMSNDYDQQYTAR